MKLKLKNIEKSFGEKKVLKGISFEAESGKAFGSALLFYGINKSAWGDNEIIESIFNIPVELFVYMLVFFILGFLIYAFLYGTTPKIGSILKAMWRA